MTINWLSLGEFAIKWIICGFVMLGITGALKDDKPENHVAKGVVMGGFVLALGVKVMFFL